MKQWEYKVLESNGSWTFPELGRQGWELVSVIWYDEICKLQFYFKREIQ